MFAIRLKGGIPEITIFQKITVIHTDTPICRASSNILPSRIEPTTQNLRLNDHVHVALSTLATQALKTHRMCSGKTDYRGFEVACPLHRADECFLPLVI